MKLLNILSLLPALSLAEFSGTPLWTFDCTTEDHKVKVSWRTV